MKQQIRRLGVGQTAKVFGVLYALLGLCFVPFFALIAMFMPDTGESSGMASMGIGVMAIAMPIVYGIIGFIFTAIAAALYNLVAGWVGGIEVEIAGGAPAGAI